MRRRQFLQAVSSACSASLVAEQAAADPGVLLRYTEQNLATPLSVFDRILVPTDSFFVRSHFGPPASEPERPLRVVGLVKKPLVFSPGELGKFRRVSVTAALVCAENGRAHFSPKVPGIQFDLGAMGQATFSGVRLADLLEKAGVASDAAHVAFAAADRPHKPFVPPFVRSIPLSRALHPATLVATHMNGEPLTLAHGAPLRLVVPGFTGQHWIKWLAEIRLQKEEAEGYFMQSAYRSPDGKTPITTIAVGSVLAHPLEGSKVAPGALEVRGVAFSGEAPIERVELSVDGGATFVKAKLEGEGGTGRFQVFRHSLDVRKPGTFRVLARATDRKGNVQPRVPVHHPAGYGWNGWHEVRFEVVP